MKNYTITVNGNVYAVTVEEGFTQAATSRAAAPAPVVAEAPAPAVAEAPVAAEAPAGSQGSVTVSAPMPGKILDIHVTVGQAVKKGESLLTLEAMKMENEIVAPSDGIIASIHVLSGDSVESGKTLVTMN